MSQSHGLDYTGSQGGLLAMAFAAGCAAASAFWLALGASVWKLFFEPQMKRLEADNAALQARVGHLEAVMLVISGAKLGQDGAWHIGDKGAPIRMTIPKPEGGSDAA